VIYVSRICIDRETTLIPLRDDERATAAKRRRRMMQSAAVTLTDPQAVRKGSGLGGAGDMDVAP
jgi:hypothetical protein